MCDHSLTGDISFQTLEQDDIDGIKYIYPYHTVSGSISQNTTWYQNRVYVVQGQVTVNSGVTLTIEPGAIVKFQDVSSSLNVYGALNANGASTNKIYFTSIKDDSVGGDTNGDGSSTSPAAGDWAQIRFNSGSGNFSNIVFKYAGYSLGGIYCPNYNSYFSAGIANCGSGNLTIADSVFSDISQYAIRLGSGTLSVSGSEFYNNSYGIYIAGGTASVTNSSLRNNSSYGLYNSTANLINAENNYWGAASGPYHPTLNPQGAGNAVSNNVDFEPWLTQWP